ncbi:MAG: site-2 protease family protein, partial [Pirellulaceae bacterium]
METRWYKLYIPRLTLGELWRAAPNILVFLILCFMKVFRLNVMPNHALAFPDLQRVVDVDELPQKAQEGLLLLREQGEAAGFAPRFATLDRHLGNRDSCSIIMSGSDRHSLLSVAYAIDWNNHKTQKITEIMFVSQAADGSFVMTTNNRQLPRLNHPVDVRVVFDNDVAAIFEQHNRRLGDQRGMVRTIATSEDLFNLALDSTAAMIEQMITRRVLTEITSEERNYLQKLNPAKNPDLPDLHDETRSDSVEQAAVSPLVPDQAAVFRDPESVEGSSQLTDEPSEAPEIAEPGLHPEDQQVLVNIHGKQSQTTGWAAKLILLLVSLAAFVGLGALAWNWELLLLLIPILLFHELGHYVAMRVLKYRNIKMFFLPLIGAGVHGRNYNAPGWQRAVVALAGPIPGILLGVMTALAGNELGIPFLIPIAILMILLNALNLLPFLPFDGGWVMQSVVFSRNLYVEYLFRIVAVGAMGLLGLLAGGRLLLFLAVFMAMGLPLAWRLCRVTSGLKRDGFRPAQQKGDELCEPTMREVVKRVRLQTQTPLAQRANISLNIYELLSARPPGIFASLALLAIQFVGLIGSVVFVWWLVTSQIPGAVWAGGMQPMPAPLPVTEISSAQIDAGQLPPALADRKLATVVVNCENDNQLEAATRHLERLDGIAISRLGQSIVVEFDAEDRSLDEQVLAIAHTIDEFSVVDRGVARTAVEMQVAFENKAAADKVRDTLESHLACQNLDVIPPWSSERSLTAEQVRARKTWRHLASIDMWDSTPELR